MVVRRAVYQLRLASLMNGIFDPFQNMCELQSCTCAHISFVQKPTYILTGNSYRSEAGDQQDYQLVGWLVSW